MQKYIRINPKSVDDVNFKRISRRKTQFSHPSERRNTFNKHTHTHTHIKLSYNLIEVKYDKKYHIELPIKSSSSPCMSEEFKMFFFCSSGFH